MKTSDVPKIARITLPVKIQSWIQKKPDAAIGLLLLLTCLWIYTANEQVLSSNDNIPNSLLALNWLEYHTLNLDAFRDSYFYKVDPNCVTGCVKQSFYYFYEAPNGHLTSAYPIGTAILTFPFYVLGFLYIKLAAYLDGAALHLTREAFDPQRLLLEKWAAALAGSLSVICFYFAVRVKFSRFVALLTAFVFGMGTAVWRTCSQGLWQHTGTVLALSILLLCLLKINHAESSRKQNILLVLAGFFSGLLPGIRPTNLLFLLAIGLYLLFTYRRQFGFFLLGLSSLALNGAWNTYFFGFGFKTFIVGGYSQILSDTQSQYLFSPAYFGEALLGLMISPSRGLLIFTPVILFSAFGIRQIVSRSTRDDRLLFALLIACLALILQYCVYFPWWGSAHYGSRFLADLLPIAIYPMAYFVAGFIERPSPDWRRILLQTGFWLLLSLSVLVQVIGAFSMPREWEKFPFWSPDRLWNVRDSVIERHAQSIWYKAIEPFEEQDQYLRGLGGRVLQVADGDRLLLSSYAVAAGATRILSATVENTGRSQWYGYQTGLDKGIMQLKAEFFDVANRSVGRVSINRSFLNIFGNTPPGKTTEAIGKIGFPTVPGTYRMVLTLAPRRMKLPDAQTQPLYTLNVEVRDRARSPEAAQPKL